MTTDPVLDVLLKYNLQYKISGKDYVIKCLNPEHDDSNPSFRVDRITGISHCFSCGYKVNIFKHFGILTNTSSLKIAKLKQKMKDLHIHFNGVEFPEEKTPVSQAFKNISAKTLRKFNAFYTLDGDEKYTDRIFFPIVDIRDSTVAFVGRHMLSNGNPRYLNYPSGVRLPVFPERLKHYKNPNLILVEGIFDMLNLYDKGLTNVACTFGTNTLHKDTSRKLLAFKTQGITKIYLMYDGDKPGKDAAAKLAPLIEEAGYEVEVLFIKENSDPGEMDQEEVDYYNTLVNKNVKYN